MCQAKTQIAYDSVDPFIGTTNGGNTFPGASQPFGMMQWSPDTNTAGWYVFGEKSIHGFSLTHLSGAGCPVFADMPILPLGQRPAANRPESAPEMVDYDHAHETAHPGYYSVTLNNGTFLELTTTARAGIAHLRFPHGQHPGILLNGPGSASSDVHIAALPPAGREHDGESLTVRSDGTIMGTVTSGGFCGTKTRYTLYIALRTLRKPTQVALWQDGKSLEGSTATGRRAAAWLDLGDEPDQILKIGLSYVSEEKALDNLKAEIPDWNFDAVRSKARAGWEEALGKISIQGATPADSTIFYTALYHNLLAPSVFSDVDGEYEGFDWKVHHVPASQHTQYANFSDWDTYRNTTPLQAWIDPARASDMAQSLVNIAEQVGSLPRWPIANDISYVMGGDSSAILLAEFYAFGARHFDTGAALHYMVQGATVPSVGLHDTAERGRSAEYLRLGYLPAAQDKANPWDISASETLEFANADFAVGQYARALGSVAVSDRMLKQSANWRNLLDPETHWIRPRNADGSWLAGFDAERSLPHANNAPVPTDQRGFQEGNTYQYSFMLPFDYAGLFESMGGEVNADQRLARYFKKLVCWGEPCFNMANEPDFVTPYAYTFLGKPAKTAEVVTRIENETFQASPGGLAGNDDLGATSGVFLWNALGMYPAIPGLGGVVLGTPRFSHASLATGAGQSLTISRSGNGIYVKAVQLNGQPWYSTWLPLAGLHPGNNTLHFDMSESAAEDWGTAVVNRPPSFSSSTQHPL